MMYEPKFVNLVFWIVHIVFWKVTPPKAIESLNFCEKVTRNSQSSLPAKKNHINIKGWGMLFRYLSISVREKSYNTVAIDHLRFKGLRCNDL